MAQLAYSSLSWVGGGFSPGTEGTWLVGGISFPQVIGVTAQPTSAPGLTRLMTVKEVHSHVDGNGNRSVLIIVRNTGPVSIAGYTVNISYVVP